MNYNTNKDMDFRCQLGGNVAYIYELYAILRRQCNEKIRHFMKTVLQITFLLIFGVNLFAQNSDDEIIKLLKSKFQLTKYDSPSEIIKFNEDTILVAGFLENLNSNIPRYEQQLNVVYKTIDGGQNWKVVNFDGNAWIYTSIHFPDGKIWMGGSDNFIHYSEDFGEKWTRKKEPFKPIDRVYSIYMANDTFGIAGGHYSNVLAITYDNWETTIQLPTPIDQNKFKVLQNSARKRIDKVAIIDSLIIINQNGYIYYSKQNPIFWQEFKIPVLDFSINKQKNEINLSSRDNKHFIINTKLDLINSYTTTEESIFSLPSINEKIELDNFFEQPIKTIKIESKEYVFDESSRICLYVPYKENKETAEISLKNGLYILNAKRYKKINVEFDFIGFKSMLLNDKNKSLNQLKEKFKFSNEDLIDYQKYLENQIKEFNERENWGGNPTIIINPQEISKSNLFEIDKTLQAIDIEDLFSKFFFENIFSSSESNNIELTFINRDNEELKISNYNSTFLSLPWTISYKNQITVFYNPELTYRLRKLIPPEFANYKLLLGGELIYRLHEQDVTNKIKY